MVYFLSHKSEYVTRNIFLNKRGFTKGNRYKTKVKKLETDVGTGIVTRMDKVLIVDEPQVIKLLYCDDTEQFKYFVCKTIFNQ